MPDNLTSGTFTVVSLINGNPPVGVGPPYIGLQFVRLNGVDTAWRVNKSGENTYQLGIDGYRSTLTTNDKVAASIEPGQNVEWIATYREFHDAYTIGPADGPWAGKIWTVPRGSGADSNAEIGISSISEPITYQLFKFVPADE